MSQLQQCHPHATAKMGEKIPQVLSSITEGRHSPCRPLTQMEGKKIQVLVLMGMRISSRVRHHVPLRSHQVWCHLQFYQRIRPPRMRRRKGLVDPRLHVVRPCYLLLFNHAIESFRANSACLISPSLGWAMSKCRRPQLMVSFNLRQERSWTSPVKVKKKKWWPWHKVLFGKQTFFDLLRQIPMKKSILNAA